MEAPNPSPAWTPEEKLEVLDFLVQGLLEHANTVPLVRSAVVTAVTRQMTIIATHPTEFLESNREQALKPVEESVRQWGEAS